MQYLIDKSLKFKAKFGFSPELRYRDCQTGEALQAYEQRIDLALKTGNPGEFKPPSEQPWREGDTTVD
jgi:hypothetical protein